jgi:flagellin-like hook-associated protein FlgL
MKPEHEALVVELSKLATAHWAVFHEHDYTFDKAAQAITDLSADLEAAQKRIAFLERSEQEWIKYRDTIEASFQAAEVEFDADLAAKDAEIERLLAELLHVAENSTDPASVANARAALNAAEGK